MKIHDSSLKSIQCKVCFSPLTHIYNELFIGRRLLRDMNLLFRAKAKDLLKYSNIFLPNYVLSFNYINFVLTVVCSDTYNKNGIKSDLISKVSISVEYESKKATKQRYCTSEYSSEKKPIS